MNLSLEQKKTQRQLPVRAKKGVGCLFILRLIQSIHVFPSERQVAWSNKRGREGKEEVGEEGGGSGRGSMYLFRTKALRH